MLKLNLQGKEFLAFFSAGPFALIVCFLWDKIGGKTFSATLILLNVFHAQVVPGYPHHMTQRGVRSMDLFADAQDLLSYLQFMAEESNRFGVTFISWCLGIVSRFITTLLF